MPDLFSIQSSIIIILFIIVSMLTILIINTFKILNFLKFNNESNFLKENQSENISIDELEKIESHIEKSLVDYVDLQFKQVKVKIKDLMKEEIKIHRNDEIPLLSNDTYNQNPIKNTNSESANIKKEAESEKNISESNAFRTFIYNYNDALINQSQQGWFINKYKPNRVNIFKSINPQTQNFALKFQFTEKGNLYIVKFSDKLFSLYAVIPSFGLIISDSNYRDSIRYLFDCTNFISKNLYNVSRIENPAIFLKKSDNMWDCKSKGKLLVARKNSI